MHEGSNVLPFLAKAPPPAPKPKETIVLCLHDVQSVRDALAGIELTAHLGLRVLDKAPDYGDGEALEGVRLLFAALSRCLAAQN
jgi:hypothetical protein